LAFGDAPGQVLVLAILLDDGRDFAVRLGSLLVLRRVVHDLRRGEGLGQLFVAGFDLVKSFKHGFGLWSLLSGLWSLVVGPWPYPLGDWLQRIDQTTQGPSYTFGQVQNALGIFQRKIL